MILDTGLLFLGHPVDVAVGVAERCFTYCILYTRSIPVGVVVGFDILFRRLPSARLLQLLIIVMGRCACGIIIVQSTQLCFACPGLLLLLLYCTAPVCCNKPGRPRRVLCTLLLPVDLYQSYVASWCYCTKAQFSTFQTCWLRGPCIVSCLKTVTSILLHWKQILCWVVVGFPLRMLAECTLCCTVFTLTVVQSA